MLVDTHCHIHDANYPLPADEVLARAKVAGVERVIVIGTCPSDARVARDFAAKREGVFWAYGYHPSEVEEPLEFFRDEKLVSIGEIGLDYHYKPFDRAAQIKRLEMMLELAEREGLAVNFHVREAFEDFWPIVDNFKLTGGAVLHSFSDNEANMNEAIRRGMFIGVNGLVTFAPVPLPPLRWMVLETDAPFLTPSPFRGKINEPSYIKNIAEWVAVKLQVHLSEVETTTTANAEKLFIL
jgi:TatD DNase family protein